MDVSTVCGVSRAFWGEDWARSGAVAPTNHVIIETPAVDPKRTSAASTRGCALSIMRGEALNLRMRMPMPARPPGMPIAYSGSSHSVEVQPNTMSIVDGIPKTTNAYPKHASLKARLPSLGFGLPKGRRNAEGDRPMCCLLLHRLIAGVPLSSLGASAS